MINQPDSQQEPYTLSGKLILPAYPDEDYQRSSRPLSAMPVQPGQLIQRKTPPLPQTPLAKLRYFWGKDPAYKVLVIAISAVVIAGILLLSLVSSTLLHNTKLFAMGNSFSQTPPTVVTPIGTIDAHPTFPPPGGGTGSSTSSQPPAQSTPVLQPTTENSTPTTDGQLTVSISGVPGHVQNNSVVSVNINTSEPNVTVELMVRYTAPPYRYTSGQYTTDGGGNATINWPVNVFAFGRHTQATVYAVAMDQNGQQAQAQSISVQIVGGYTGG
nr:hypothetical protein [Ktedonobacteraceae bacterium]